MGRLSDILRGNGGDFNDTWDSTEAAGDFGPVPRGVYVCHATKGELESSRSKSTPGYKIEFTILDGDFKGRKLWHDCWLTPAALPQAKRDLLKLGITSPAQMEQPLPKWIRCNVTAVVRRDDDGIERYSLDDDGPLMFFSESKGFHLGLPTDLWQPSASLTFHRTARRLAEGLAAAAQVTIDGGVYDTVRAFRAPNSRHPEA